MKQEVQQQDMKGYRAAIYFRVSTEEQANEGQSIPAQRRALIDYAIRNGYEVVAEYADEGVSARTDQRPQFQRMIAEAKIKPKPFDIILVHKWDRFARNREDSIIYKKLLRRECGIDVTSISEPLEDGPVGVLLEGILELLAEFYSLNLSQEVYKGMKQGASQGKAMGMTPFGYRIGEDGKYEIIEDEAKVVKWLFKQYVNENQGLRSLAIFLRRSGPSVFGEVANKHKWSATGLRGLITNPAYKGSLVWNRRKPDKQNEFKDEDAWIVSDSAHEPIIDEETWEKANEILTGRRRPRAQKTEYLLYGLVRCKDCGGGMSKQYMAWSNGGRKIKRDLLRCTRNAHSGECYYNYIWMDDLEQAVLTYLEGANSSDIYSISNVVIKEKKQEPQDDESKELLTIQKALDLIEERYDRQIQAFEQGLLDVDQLRRAKERLDDEKRDLKKRHDELEQRVSKIKPTATTSLGKQYLQRYLDTLKDETIPITKRREALASVVQYMEYSKKDDDLKIYLNA